MNEELQTVNHELNSKVDELSRSNNDMKNLLNSTDIATLFLDEDLRVRRFTSPTAGIIKLIPSDVGRPISDIARDVDYPELIDDARFKTLADRSKNRKQMNAELDKILAKKPSAEWIETLNRAGVPSGPIFNVKEVYENEQIKHLGMAKPVRHPERGEMLVQGLPVTLSRTPGAIRRAAPTHGEHTDEILRELGYGPEEIATLRKDAVV